MKVRTLALCLLLMTWCLVIGASAQVNGALQTTDVTGLIVNYNVNPPLSCDAVYLTGGAQNTSSAGISPTGTYYFQVTDPSGKTVLSSDLVGDRTLAIGTASDGATGRFLGTTGTHPNGNFNSANGETGVLLWPFAQSSNNGGVYKAWISTDPTFTNSTTKTDNFKCVQPPITCAPDDLTCICNENPNDPRCSQPPSSATIVGTKFYDFNNDGVQDNGEVGIQDWLITINPAAQGGATCNLTDSAGGYLFLVDPSSGDYTITEAESIETNWHHSTATSGIATAGTGTIQGPNFGNLCTGAGGGLTLGFWSNKNGQKLETSAELAFLSSLNLVNADGTPFDPTSPAQLSAWLLNANAVNMANMLSAQLAAMELNVLNGKVQSSAVLLVGTPPDGCTDLTVTNGEITVGDLMTSANTELLAPGNVTLSSTTPTSLRACAEFKKTALDNANNNLNFVQATACAHTFDQSACTF